MMDQLSSRPSPERLAVGALEAARRFLSPSALSYPESSSNTGKFSAAINAIDLAADELEVILLGDVHVSVELARSFLLDVIDLHPVLVANVGGHLAAAIRELDQAADRLAHVSRPSEIGNNRPG